MANLNDLTVKSILRVYGKIKANEIYGSLIGNADTSTKFSTNKIIQLTGDATGSATGDFGTTLSIPVTVTDDGHNHTFGTISGTNPVAKGGTGKASVAINSMLYASAADTYSEVASSVFGRSLLNATSGAMFTGFNADQVDGKHVDDAQTSTSYLWTAGKVKAYVDALLASNDAMIFKGTIGSGATVTALPTTGYSAGWCYKVTTAAIFAGIQCEIGDLILCIKDYATAYADSDWTVFQSNIDGAVVGPTSSTDGHVALFNGATGKLIKDSGKTLPAGNIVGDTSYGTAATGGVVKSSSSNNQVAIDAAGIMTVNVIDATKGGTGKNSIAANSMLYASAANTYAEVVTSAFGRSLLNAASGTMFTGFNADQVDGKQVDDAQTSTSYLWTAGKTKAYVDALLASNDAMVFKGTLGTGGTITALPTTGYGAGQSYKVITAGTYAGIACEVGDLIICIKDYVTAYADADWTVVQTNIDGAVVGPTSSVDGNVVLFNGTTGKLIKDSGKALPAGNIVGDTSYGTAAVGGVVKSSAANNQVAIDAAGIMTVNAITTSKLSGAVAVANGGLNKTSIAVNAMLYASAANVYSEVASSAFGRSLLNAASGTMFAGLNADMVDGLHVHSGTAYGIAWGYIPRVQTDGIVELGKFIDFHELSGDTGTDYTYRLTATAAGLEGSNRFSAPVLRATQKANIGDAFDIAYNATTKSLDITFLL